jgi:hypothetical protein
MRGLIAPNEAGSFSATVAMSKMSRAVIRSPRCQSFSPGIRFLDVVRRQRLGLVIEARTQIIEILRIGYEDVDVLAEAMMVATHQDGTATEAPVRQRLTRRARRINDHERALE